MDFEEAQEMAMQFRRERDWEQFHNPKDLAISVSLEAAELLETFQWSGDDLEVSEKRESAADELADVLIYCIYMADALGVDIPDIICNKLEKDGEKYPAGKAKGSAKKYTEL